jgi:CRISPR-associated protein Cmr4
MEHLMLGRRYFAQALDPIHIGTGGERLSRVDLAIIRDPGTDLPKLPGTSLSGACRNYAALRIDKPRCAGQGQVKKDKAGNTVREEHCGESNCSICQTFGYANGSGKSKIGAAQFYDAHIVAFPIASQDGPLWVTCDRALTRAAVSFKQESESPALAIGWLLLPGVATGTLTASEGSQFPGIGRVALVSNDLFSKVVNDNLEVRTSVAIDPGTGAADDGALFTYEAIPAGTIFAFDVIYQPKEWRPKSGETPPDKTAQQVVESGLKLFAWLGVGGMNTRGMGRLRVEIGGQQ